MMLYIKNEETRGEAYFWVQTSVFVCVGFEMSNGYACGDAIYVSPELSED